MLQTNRMLQKEQADLYAIERKLLQALPKVQEALNSLKVEELHLKSQTIQRAIPPQPQVVPTTLSRNFDSDAQTELITPDEQINQQQINLDLFLNKLQHFDVEIDSD